MDEAAPTMLDRVAARLRRRVFLVDGEGRFLVDRDGKFIVWRRTDT